VNITRYLFATKEKLKILHSDYICYNEAWVIVAHLPAQSNLLIVFSEQITFVSKDRCNLPDSQLSNKNYALDIAASSYTENVCSLQRDY